MTMPGIGFRRKKETPAPEPEKPVFTVSMMIVGINTGACATYLIDKPAFTLGKAPGCDGVLDFSEEISREHARITWADGKYTLTDLHSMNGTFLNGRAVLPDQPQPLKDGDRIGISTFLFSVEQIRR
ncbi:MAG: FHA domain-containing protein [Clostridia bacterium]|nr:FHA domain-containing protein [Clostridia bacterium]